MRTHSKLFACVASTVALALFTTLAACGGGSSGGGSGSLAAFLSMAGVRMGNLSAGAENATPYPALPAGGVPVPPMGPVSVAPAVFPAGNPGSQDFIELTFNVPLDANTIFGGFGTGGITVFNVTGPTATQVSMSLDVAGQLNPANAFSSQGVAPAVLKLYIDVDNDITTPEGFPTGDYLLAINNNLKGFNGSPFCVNLGSPNCVNSYLPQLSFTIGTQDTTPLAISASSPTSPVAGDPLVPLSEEIIINFSEAVDFATLVGAANLTTLDPFITVPRMLTEPGCQTMQPVPAFSDAGHLLLVYSPPTNPVSMVQATLPPDLSYVVYMPDPFLNPAQVRIRFVNGTNLVGQGTGQNYASNPRKLPIPGPNGPLPLPGKRTVPGSLPGYVGVAGDLRAATVDIFVMSPTFMAVPPLPGPPDDACYSPTVGAPDRSGNPLNADFQFSFKFVAGPAVASNPVPPDAVIVLRQTGDKGLSALNMAGATTDVAGPGTNTQVPITYGSAITGVMAVAPASLSSPSTLGTPLDLEIGAFLNVNSPATNNITNPPRGSTTTPGVPDDPNGTTPVGLLDVLGVMTGPPVQPLGNFLYVVDGDAGEVKVLNSYNWQPITSLTGIADPRGLGMSPDLAFLYITNFGQGTVTRVFTNPAAPTLHTIANLITVNAGPTAIAVQGQNKDLFVAEFVSNSYSRVSVTTQAIRKTLGTGPGPNEVVVGLEMLGQGLTNAYLAYIYNFFDDTVTVFEEDSPAAPENQPDGKEVARPGGFDGPVRGAWNWQSYIAGTFEPGAFVVNSQGTSVDEMSMMSFVLGPPPGIQGTPAQRNFHIAKSYSGFLVGNGTASPTDASIDAHSGLYNVFLSGVTNNKSIIDPSFNGSGAVPSLVLVAFPGEGLVAAFDYNSPALFGTVSVPGADLLVGYYDQ